MKTFNVEITGKTPLLMHRDNIEWADFMEDWRNDPDNKKLSKPGDDRTPAWRWLGCVYHDGTILGVPSENIMRSLMEGGAMVPVPGGKSGKTFKSQTQSGMMSAEPLWPLTLAGKPLNWNALEGLRAEDKFGAHKQHARGLGFDLLVKRAKIGKQKHVRVRPQFPAGWMLRGTIAVWDPQIDLRTLAQILSFAGQYKGLGDWRPGSTTPGPYGTFSAVVS